jgi:hypothetical protein
MRRTFDPGQRLMLAILVPILAGVMFFTVNLLIPYRPVTAYGYTAIPPVVCPGEPVEVWAEWEVRDHLDRLHVEYGWSQAGEDSILYGGEDDFKDIPPFERRVVRSPIIRSAPADPGRWRLSNDYEAHGRRLGLPARQDLDDVTSDDFVQVLSHSAPECAGDEVE